MNHRPISNKKMREKLRKLQGGKCCYCDCVLTEAEGPRKSKPPAYTSETLEHLVRREDGGTNHPDNLAVACFRCNRERGHMDWFTYKTWRRGEFWEEVA